LWASAASAAVRAVVNRATSSSSPWKGPVTASSPTPNRLVSFGVPKVTSSTGKVASAPSRYRVVVAPLLVTSRVWALAVSVSGPVVRATSGPNDRCSARWSLSRMRTTAPPSSLSSVSNGTTAVRARLKRNNQEKVLPTARAAVWATATWPVVPSRRTARSPASPATVLVWLRVYPPV
jgi:hypothetical protein